VRKISAQFLLERNILDSRSKQVSPVLAQTKLWFNAEAMSVVVWKKETTINERSDPEIWESIPHQIIDPSPVC